MARPLCCRRIDKLPRCCAFEPVGAPPRVSEEICLTLDELEALRLADLDQLDQQAAAARMRVSRQTFGRIVGTARKKIARMLVEGRILRIQGGVVDMKEELRGTTRTLQKRRGE